MTPYMRRPIRHERPRLIPRDGAWTVRLKMLVNPNLIGMRFQSYPGGGLRAVLHSEFESWLALHDPDHQKNPSQNEIEVIFSNENAAMLFRLTYDAEIVDV